MSKLRERLKKRQREREMQPSGYESMFNYSPSVTTLLSTITEPLILLIINLTFSPCIFNRLITAVNGRLEVPHLMLLQGQYEQAREGGVTPTLQQVRELLSKFNEQN
ncbi:ENV1 protein, partial [Mionectes macconnelli]|nr:ENV1 protein [Mionectes macconnelli]